MERDYSWDYYIYRNKGSQNRGNNDIPPTNVVERQLLKTGHKVGNSITATDLAVTNSSITPIPGSSNFTIKAGKNISIEGRRISTKDIANFCKLIVEDTKDIVLEKGNVKCQTTTLNDIRYVWPNEPLKSSLFMQDKYLLVAKALTAEDTEKFDPTFTGSQVEFKFELLEDTKCWDCTADWSGGGVEIIPRSNITKINMSAEGANKPLTSVKIKATDTTITSSALTVDADQEIILDSNDIILKGNSDSGAPEIKIKDQKVTIQKTDKTKFELSQDEVIVSQGDSTIILAQDCINLKKGTTQVDIDADRILLEDANSRVTIGDEGISLEEASATFKLKNETITCSSEKLWVVRESKLSDTEFSSGVGIGYGLPEKYDLNEKLVMTLDTSEDDPSAKWKKETSLGCWDCNAKGVCGENTNEDTKVNIAPDSNIGEVSEIRMDAEKILISATNQYAILSGYNSGNSASDTLFYGPFGLVGNNIATAGPDFTAFNAINPVQNNGIQWGGDRFVAMVGEQGLAEYDCGDTTPNIYPDGIFPNGIRTITYGRDEDTNVYYVAGEKNNVLARANRQEGPTVSWTFTPVTENGVNIIVSEKHQDIQAVDIGNSTMRVFVAANESNPSKYYDIDIDNDTVTSHELTNITDTVGVTATTSTNVEKPSFPVVFVSNSGSNIYIVEDENDTTGTTLSVTLPSGVDSNIEYKKSIKVDNYMVIVAKEGVFSGGIINNSIQLKNISPPSDFNAENISYVPAPNNDQNGFGVWAVGGKATASNPSGVYLQQGTPSNLSTAWTPGTWDASGRTCLSVSLCPAIAPSDKNYYVLPDSLPADEKIYSLTLEIPKDSSETCHQCKWVHVEGGDGKETGWTLNTDTKTIQADSGVDFIDMNGGTVKAPKITYGDSEIDFTNSISLTTASQLNLDGEVYVKAENDIYQLPKTVPSSSTFQNAVNGTGYQVMEIDNIGGEYKASWKTLPVTTIVGGNDISAVQSTFTQNVDTDSRTTTYAVSFDAEGKEVVVGNLLGSQNQKLDILPNVNQDLHIAGNGTGEVSVQASDTGSLIMKTTGSTAELSLASPNVNILAVGAASILGGYDNNGVDAFYGQFGTQQSVFTPFSWANSLTSIASVNPAGGYISVFGNKAFMVGQGSGANVDKNMAVYSAGGSQTLYNVSGGNSTSMEVVDLFWNGDDSQAYMLTCSRTGKYTYKIEFNNTIPTSTGTELPNLANALDAHFYAIYDIAWIPFSGGIRWIFGGGPNSGVQGSLMYCDNIFASSVTLNQCVGSNGVNIPSTDFGVTSTLSSFGGYHYRTGPVGIFANNAVLISKDGITFSHSMGNPGNARKGALVAMSDTEIMVLAATLNGVREGKLTLTSGDWTGDLTRPDLSTVGNPADFETMSYVPDNSGIPGNGWAVFGGPDSSQKSGVFGTRTEKGVLVGTAWYELPWDAVGSCRSLALLAQGNANGYSLPGIVPSTSGQDLVMTLPSGETRAVWQVSSGGNPVSSFASYMKVYENTTSTPHTVQIPPGAKTAKIKITGGGGGGRYPDDSSSTNGGGGGGAGATILAQIAVNEDASQSITINSIGNQGNAGVSDDPSGAAQDGGNTQITLNSTVPASERTSSPSDWVLTAYGGKGALNGQNATGGGPGGNWESSQNGSNTKMPDALFLRGGGGGSGSLNSVSGQTKAIEGSGGISYWGGGNNGDDSMSTNPTYGSGGGGGGLNHNAANKGGPGVVVIEWS